MKEYTYTEFIRYDDSFQKGKNDFYGTLSPLDEDDTKQFFEKYLHAKTLQYGEDCLERKAVSQEELREAVALINKKKGLTFEASKRTHNSGYSSWQLYTDRATVEADKIILNDSYRLPTASAKCEFPEMIKKLTLSVFFDKAYERPIPGGAMITTPGKLIELRCGITDSVKLFFAEDGELLIRENIAGDAYNLSSKRLGKYPFSEEFLIELELSESSYTVCCLGNTVTLPYLFGARPDTLFLSGGLQPTSLWYVRILSAINEVGEQINIFEKSSSVFPEEKIGNVTLPFVIGTEKDKDKELILRTEIECKQGSSYALRLEALDPHGDVFVNGRLAYHADSFEPFTLPLDEYVREGCNKIELVVSPRAPELLYIWHRHRDPYNGWFSLSCELLEGEEIPEGRPVVTTIGDRLPESFEVKWGTALKGDVGYKAYIRSSYPSEGAFTEISSGKLQSGNLYFTNKCNYALWNTEDPRLYEIKIELYRKGAKVYTDIVEVGFRTIVQRDGAIYLNGKKTVLKGALNMQFLPPYEEVPKNHVCPSAEQICEQVTALKNLGGNTLRLHQLGHGSSDKRFAEICDRLGVMLIWTTRAIDSAEHILWNKSAEQPWRLAELYKRQMKPFLNHPSIIMWEGSNELHAELRHIDWLYDSFVSAVKEVDSTRLICPVSHLYYGGGLYGGPEATTDYYNNDGTSAADGESVCSSFGWLDGSVVRSAHTYSLLLGYGAPWQNMVNQSWKWQKELFEAKDKAYIVSEFAVIGRQNPNTDGAKEFINRDSYELGNEKNALGYLFTDGEWALSQAYQALCADMAIRQLRRHDADGMIWCALQSGANNGSYLKPPIDFMGYRKLAFYRMRDGFAECMAANESPDVLFYKGYEITPVCTGLTKGRRYSLTVEITDEHGSLADSRSCADFSADADIITLEGFAPCFPENGYYNIKYILTEK